MTWRRRQSGLYLREGSGLALPGRRPHLHPIAGIVASQGVGGGGAGWGWAPSDVSGLVFWFASDRGINVDGLGQLLSIDDQSANSFNVQQVTGGGFLISRTPNATAGIDEIFHNPGGSNWARLAFTDTDPLNGLGLTAAHMFWGVKFKADPQATTAETGLWYLNTDTANISLFWTDGNFYDAMGGSSRYLVGNPGVAMTSYRCVEVRNQSGANGYQFHIDGTQLGSSQTGDGSSWPTTPWLGMSDNFPTNVCSFNGRWIDWFMYDHVLTGSDLTNARAFVAARFDGSWFAAGGDG